MLVEINLLCNFIFCLQRETSHFFGFVYFRQVKDISVKRGYFQKVCSPVHTCTYLFNFNSCVIMGLFVSVSGAGVQVAIHSPFPLAAADHCPRVFWEAGAVSRSRWCCYACIITIDQSEETFSLWFLFVILTVCNEIDQWASPVPGLTLNLPLMGAVLQVSLQNWVKDQSSE